LITSEKQIINHLSRIRVWPKANNDRNENIEVLGISSTEEPITSSINTSDHINNFDKTCFDTNSKPVQTLNHICSKYSEFDNYINNETVSVSTKPQNNNQKVLIKEEVDKSLGDQSVINSIKSELVANSNCGYGESTYSESNSITNYLGLNNLKCGHLSTSSQLAFEVRVEKIGNISTIALKYSSDDIKAFKKLLQIMAINRYRFQMNPSNDFTLNDKWITVSNEMIRNGFKDWKPQKCRDSFMGSVNWYKKVFKRI